jgi:enoyl-CoA hydratase
MNQGLTIEKRETVMIIGFNRPEIRNPLSVVVLESMNHIFDDATALDGIMTLIFIGSDNVFASGADLREIAAVTPETAVEFARRGQDLMDKIAALPQTTLGAINGFCFGGALDLALACNKRIATQNATFCHPGTGLGIITGWGGTQRLPRLIGRTMALEMFFTARPIDAVEALRIGLIDEIASDPLERSIALSDLI